MNNKRGLSDVITNVLIIVIVIAAVAILWSFLRPTIQKGAESTESAQCFQIDLQPTSCIKTNDTGASVSYQWVGGDGELSGVKLVLVRDDGSSTIINGSSLTQLETKTITNVSFGGTPKEFSAVAVVRTASGKDIICTQTQKVECN